MAASCASPHIDILYRYAAASCCHPASLLTVQQSISCAHPFQQRSMRAATSLGTLDSSGGRKPWATCAQSSAAAAALGSRITPSQYRAQQSPTQAVQSLLSDAWPHSR